MKQQLKDYFSFSRSERRGLTVLVSVVCIVLLGRCFYPLLRKEVVHSDPEFAGAVAAWKEARNKSDRTPGERTDPPETVDNLFEFDPNTVSLEDLLRLGVPRNVCYAWINFRKSGATFCDENDLRKVYGLDNHLLLRLRPCLNYPRACGETGKATAAEKKRILDLNSATESQLEELPGIGPVLARRIIKYRKLLGGFREIDQLAEVYGLRAEIISDITDYLTADTALIRTIDLNTADEITMALHPYVSEYYARAILDFRKYKGSITSYNELINNKIIPDSVSRKMQHYFSISSQ